MSEYFGLLLSFAGIGVVGVLGLLLMSIIPIDYEGNCKSLYSIIPLDECVSNYNAIVIADEEAFSLLNGYKLNMTHYRKFFGRGSITVAYSNNETIKYYRNKFLDEGIE